MSEIRIGVIDLGYEDGEELARSTRHYFKREGLRLQLLLPKDHHPGWDIYSDHKLADLGIKESCFSDPAHAYMGQKEFEKIREDAIRYGGDHCGQEDVEFESDGEDCATLANLMEWLFELLNAEGSYNFMGYTFTEIQWPNLDDEENEYESK